MIKRNLFLRLHGRLLLASLLPLMSLIAASCGLSDSQPATSAIDSVQQSTVTSEPSASTPTQHPSIILPLTAYILDDSTGVRTSQRTTEQLEQVYKDVNAIWAPSGITIELRAVHRVELPPPYLTAVRSHDFDRFFGGIVDEIDLPEPSLLNAFYASDIGGPNGITPYGTRTFFVTDFPSVHHERVTSHEIGHILGLHHVLDDQTQLMYSGTNGMGLTEEEIDVARYAAIGMLSGVR